MVGIKDILRLGDITLQLRLLAPRNTQKRVEIITDHRRFGRHRRHATQLFQFGIGLCLCFLGKLHSIDFALKLGNLVTAFAIIIAKLALNGLHLLIQIIFALGLFHLALHAAANFLLDLQNAKLALHERERHFKTTQGICLDQQGLLIGDFQLYIGRNGIGQRRWRIDLGQLNSRFGRHFLVEL